MAEPLPHPDDQPARDGLAARIHDGPIQRLTAARVQLGLVAFDPPERRPQRLAEIEAELSEAAGELVTLVRELSARVRSEG